MEKVHIVKLEKLNTREGEVINIFGSKEDAIHRCNVIDKVLDVINRDLEPGDEWSVYTEEHEIV